MEINLYYEDFIMENKRILELIRIPLQQSGYITIQNVSTLLQVSNKTIRNDLNIVAEFLNEHALSLCRKTGVGIYINGSEEAKLTLLNSISTRTSQVVSYSPKARKNYIGLRLITCAENCRIYELASELFVSRATIHKDISALSTQFATYNIHIIRKNNHGINLFGKERHLRDLMFDLMQEDAGYSEFIKIIQNPDYQCHQDFIFKALDYTDENIHKLVHLIIHSGNPYINSLPFNSLSAVLLRIFICIMRITEGHPIILSQEFVEELKDKALFPEIFQLTTMLEKELNLTFPEEELRYLQIHFLSLDNKTGITENDQHELTQLVDELLLNWEHTLQLPFTQDYDLRESLISHLGPMLTRFRHGISIKNPMLEEIYAYYHNTFFIVKKSLETLTKQYSCNLSDDEIGYITIYLAASLELKKQPLKTILICHGGTGVIKLLLCKIIPQIPEIEIIAQESFLTIQNTDLSQAELILSTLNINLNIDIPILTINPIMHDHDISRLKNIVKKYYNEKNRPVININV